MIPSSSHKGLRYYHEALAGNSAHPDLLDELIVLHFRISVRIVAFLVLGGD
jgi:hypothetical protein